MHIDEVGTLTAEFAEATESVDLDALPIRGDQIARCAGRLSTLTPTELAAVYAFMFREGR